ncbi:MAG: c-type cytochrome biogenesis protein CcsB [Desulfuromonadales bacterium]|nr:c-type cytochrome biogenesis protein CcsB [Desulfuromonadales bacterium]
MSVNIMLYKITLVVYIAATILFLIDVLLRRTSLGNYARGTLLIGLLVHTATLATRYAEVGQTPVANLHEALSFFAWMLIGSYLLIDLRYRLDSLGVMVCPLAVIMLLAGGVIFYEVPHQNPMLDSWWFPVHVTLAFAGYAVFTLAFLVGIMYLLQERMLKTKSFSGLYYRLPSLDILDIINYRCLSFGFPLMTMAIITGAVWANQAWGGYWRWDPKETSALVTWFLYAALLHGRLNVGWRGRRAAIVAIIGFIFLIFSLFGVNLMLSDEHSFDAFKSLR